MQHTGRCNPCYLKYEKEKERRVLSTMSLLGETLRRNQRREKREPTRETPQNTFVYRGGGGLYFLSFFSLFVVLRSSGIMGFITSAYIEFLCALLLLLDGACAAACPLRGLF